LDYKENRLSIGKDFLEFISHARNYLSGDVISKALFFLTIPFFTRIMPPDEYGVMAIFITMVGIFKIFFGFGIPGSISRYYYEKNKDFYKFLNSNIFFVLIGSILLILFSLLLRNAIQSLFNIPMPMIYFGLGSAMTGSVFDIYKSYLQASKKSKKFGIMVITESIIVVAFAIIIMLHLQDDRYYGRAYSQILASILMMLVSFFFLRNHLNIRVYKKHLKYSLAFGLPVIFHLLAQNVLNTFDQIIINKLLGSKEAGLYALAYKIGMIQLILTMSVFKAWSPMFYEKMNYKKNKDINKLVYKLGLLISLSATFLILFSKELMIILADKLYYESLPVVPIVIFGYFFFFLYTIYVSFAFYYKKTRSVALITIIAGGINIGLNYLFIPVYGYIAAAWATMISYALLFILHYINVRWIIKSEICIKLNNFIFPLIIIMIAGVLNNFLIYSKWSYPLIVFSKAFVFIIIGFFIFLLASKNGLKKIK